MQLALNHQNTEHYRGSPPMFVELTKEEIEAAHTLGKQEFEESMRNPWNVKKIKNESRTFSREWSFMFGKEGEFAVAKAFGLKVSDGLYRDVGTVSVRTTKIPEVVRVTKRDFYPKYIDVSIVSVLKQESQYVLQGWFIPREIQSEVEQWWNPEKDIYQVPVARLKQMKDLTIEQFPNVIDIVVGSRFANFDSEVLPLKQRELGAIPKRTTK